MTRKLADTLNLPHLDDILKEEGTMQSPEEQEEETRDTTALVKNIELAEKALAMMEGKDHSDAMDVLYKETLDHARNITDLGYNVDHARAARMFEVAANFYKAAMDAKNSKRDAQLKAMQLALAQQKLAHEQGQAPQNQTVDVQAVIVEDRNELIRRYREQQKQDKPTE